MERYASRTDAELLGEAHTDADAFAALYARYARAAVAWSRRAGIAEPDILDAVAELFAQAWCSRRRFRDPGDGSAGAWLHGIGRHIAAHYHRRGSVEAAARRRLGLDAELMPAPPEEPIAASGTDPVLEDALAALPPAQAAAVRLRVIDELDYAEIGTRLRCTPTTARKHVSIGLKRLRRDLTQETS
jgi:RNA polymerase sigma factor (sigma-70 family)